MWSLIDIGYSLGKGFFLGSAMYTFGYLLDATVAYTSVNEIIFNDPILYIDGQNKVRDNLLLITPVVYVIVDKMLLSNTTEFSVIKCVSVLLIQNIGYFSIHKLMHTHPLIESIHNFHHRYKKNIYPSTGSSVSIEEYLLAYLFPFIFGAYVVKPNEITFITSIGIVGIFNYMIHTKELKNISWVPGFVSPTDHIVHHYTRKGYYSAPLLNMDTIYQIINNKNNRS